MAIDISIVPGGIPPTVKVSQYDAGRIIDVNIDMGDISVTAGLSYLMEVRKADQRVTSVNGTHQSNGCVRFVTTQQMTAVAGIAFCKVRVKYGTTDLGTAKFYMLIEETPFNEGADLSDSEISPILAALAASSEEAVAAQHAAEAATSEAQAASRAASAAAASIQNYIEQIQANADAIATVTVITDSITGLKYRLAIRDGEVYMKEVTGDDDS